MKKILFLIIIVFGLFFFQNFSFAGSKDISVHVTEKIPGAGCTGSGTNITCTIEPGFRSVSKMIGKVIKWLTAIVVLAGVLFIVINGISLSTGATEKNKEKIIMAISGLILLLLSGLILNIIAPWIYK